MEPNAARYAVAFTLKKTHETKLHSESNARASEGEKEETFWKGTGHRVSAFFSRLAEDKTNFLQQEKIKV